MIKYIKIYLKKNIFFSYLYFSLYCLFFLPLFILEIINYKFAKKNSEFSYQLMIKFFIITGGLSNRILCKILSFSKIDINNFEINFFHKNNLFFHSPIINNELKKNGYHILAQKLPENEIKEIYNKIFDLSGKYRSDNYTSSNNELLNINKPKGAKFVYDSDQLLEIDKIQKILLDKRIINIAQNYLGCLPVIDIVAAWWNFPSTKADHNAAQLWHFDMDRPKWIKVFIYLTDCNLNNGPHCFVESSHQKIPYQLRSKGYVRLEDHEVSKFFHSDKIKTFTADKGTVLFEDTRGLHKGLKVNADSRLLLQFQYSSSLFGSKQEKLKFPKNQTDVFKSAKDKNPEIFLNFDK